MHPTSQLYHAMTYRHPLCTMLQFLHLRLYPWYPYGTRVRRFVWLVRGSCARLTAVLAHIVTTPDPPSFHTQSSSSSLCRNLLQRSPPPRSKPPFLSLGPFNKFVQPTCPNLPRHCSPLAATLPPRLPGSVPHPTGSSSTFHMPSTLSSFLDRSQHFR